MSASKPIFPWHLRLLVGGVAVTAGVLTLNNLSRLGNVTTPQWVAALVFGSLAAASHFRPSWTIHQQVTYRTVVAAYFAVAMVLPTSMIAPVILLSWIPWLIVRVRTRRTLAMEATFNISLDITAAVLARDVYLLVESLIPSPTMALLLGAVTFVGVQVVLVTVVVVIYRKTSLREVDSLKVGILSAELVTVIVGGITAMLYQLDPLSLLVLFLPLGYLHVLMERVRDSKAAYVDAKTGLFNYKYIDERLPQELARVKATGVPLSIIFADLDYLREINNRFGHLAGDIAIRHVGNVLKQTIHDNQFVARFGGEEYMLVLPQMGHEEALRTADRARRLVAESEIQAGDARFSVTMSFGVATAPEDGTSVRDLIHAADTAVYQSKANGRNCVTSCRKGAEPWVAFR